MLQWHFSPPAPSNRNSAITSSNQVVSNPGMYSDYVIQVLDSAPVPFRGHVTIQGRPPQPSPLQSVPLTITLMVPGGDSPISYSTTTDANGNFTFMVPQGTYNYWVKSAQTLAIAGRMNIVGSEPQSDLGELLTGDADNNNVVNIEDFVVLKASFGMMSTDPGYDARADFNGDNLVESRDFTLMVTNFGVGGAELLNNPEMISK